MACNSFSVFFFPFSLCPPPPSSLLLPAKQKDGGRVGERERIREKEWKKKKKGFSTWLETKITSRKEVTLGGNCFWSLKGEK